MVAPRNAATTGGTWDQARYILHFSVIYPHGKRIETENEPLKVLRDRIEGGQCNLALGAALVVGTVSGSAR